MALGFGVATAGPDGLVLGGIPKGIVVATAGLDGLVLGGIPNGIVVAEVDGTRDVEEELELETALWRLASENWMSLCSSIHFAWSGVQGLSGT